MKIGILQQQLQVSSPVRSPPTKHVFNITALRINCALPHQPPAVPIRQHLNQTDLTIFAFLKELFTPSVVKSNKKLYLLYTASQNLHSPNPLVSRTFLLGCSFGWGNEEQLWAAAKCLQLCAYYRAHSPPRCYHHHGHRYAGRTEPRSNYQT